ncbi:MAG: hypothetical protein ABIQ93_12520, partial [Saprospiraceae bacterium]
MKKIKILGLIALMLTSSLVNTGCPTCKDTLALCDLAIKAFTAPIDAVFVGQAFDAVSNISNQEKGGECTTTEIAASTANLLEVLLKDNAGNWNLLNSKSDISQ